MNAFRKLCFLIFLPFVWLSCTESKNEAAGIEPISYVSDLAAVLTAEKPAALYNAAYRAFRLRSEGSMASGQPESPPAEAKTLMERNEDGDVHFARSSLAASPRVELIYVQRNTFLKPSEAEPFRKVRYQNEFDRWINQSFEELFSLYAKAGFSDLSVTEKKEKMNCFKKEGNSLCVDTLTGLPLEGSFRTKEAQSGQVLDLRFSVAPAEPKSIVIEPPQIP